MTEVNQNGLFKMAFDAGLSLVPVPALRGTYRAHGLRQIGEWILAQDYGAFQGWTLDSTAEDDHTEEDKSWKGKVVLVSPKGNKYRMLFDICLAEPPKPKAFAEMTDTEKFEALAKAMAKSGLNL